MVDLSTATHNIFIAERAVWRKNIPRSRAWKISCNFEYVEVSPRGVITDCTFRVYLRSNYTKRVLALHLKADVVSRQRHGLDKRGKGIVWYSPSRSIEVNPTGGT